jgi:hypothetical protein
MSPELMGVIAGLVFGAITVGLMLPMSFPNKPAALSAAFVERFAIGTVIGCVHLSWPGWLVGMPNSRLKARLNAASDSRRGTGRKGY